MTKEELAELYREQTTRAAQPRAGCLTAEEMVHVATGEASQLEHELVATHLVTCSDCAEEYRLIGPLKPWAQAVAATYPRLPEETAESGDRPVPEPQLPARGSLAVSRAGWWHRLAPAFSSAGLPYAFAALMLIVGLGVWAVSLRQENRRLAAHAREQAATRGQVETAARSLAETRRELEEAARRSGQYEAQIAELRQRVDQLAQSPPAASRPEINVPIIDLDPRGSLRGQGGGAKTVQVPASAGLFTCVLNVSGQPSFPDYVLEVRDRHGKLVWRGQGLRRSPYNTFTVALPRSLFPAGQYQLRLYGLRGQRRELVEEYVVRIVYR